MRLMNDLKRLIATYISHVYHNWGVTFVERGRSREAVKLCTKSISLNPNVADTYLQRGIAYTQLCDYDRALVDFDMALEFPPHRGPQRAEILIRRGLAFYYAGDIAEAISDFNMALYYQPRHSMSYVYRGMVEMASRNLTAAISDFTQAIHYSPENYIAYRHRGDAYVKTGNLRQALRDYWRYVELGTLRNAHLLDEVRAKINDLQRQLSAA